MNVRINGIGLSSVVGYFTEGGYLGLLVKPLDPPEWFVRQKGYNVTAHVFGAEIDVGDFSAPYTDGPNQEQLAALQRYATVNGGNWKKCLLAAWSTGKDEREADGGLLRQVRNEFGPTWLMSEKNRVVPLKRI